MNHIFFLNFLIFSSDSHLIDPPHGPFEQFVRVTDLVDEDRVGRRVIGEIFVRLDDQRDVHRTRFDDLLVVAFEDEYSESCSPLSSEWAPGASRLSNNAS